MNKCKECGADAGVGFVVCASCAAKKTPSLTTTQSTVQSAGPSELVTSEKVMFSITLLVITAAFVVSSNYDAVDMFLIRLIGGILFLGIWPALIANHKGRRGVGLFIMWMIYGGALFIVAIIHALIMKSNEPEVTARPHI